MCYRKNKFGDKSAFGHAKMVEICPKKSRQSTYNKDQLHIF